MKKSFACSLLFLLVFQACKKNDADPQVKPPQLELVDDSPPDYDNPDGEWTLTQWVSGDLRRHYSYAPGRKLVKVTDDYVKVYKLTYDANDQLEKVAPYPSVDSLLIGYMNGRITLIRYYKKAVELGRDSVLYNEEGKISGIVWNVYNVPKELCEFEWEGGNIVSRNQYLIKNDNRDTSLYEREVYTYDDKVSSWKTGNISFEWLLGSDCGELLSANNLVKIERYAPNGSKYPDNSVSYTYNDRGLPERSVFTNSSRQLEGGKTNNFFYRKK